MYIIITFNTFLTKIFEFQGLTYTYLTLNLGILQRIFFKTYIIVNV